MKMFGKEYIKVREVEANETGWARVEKDKLFLDNEFANCEVGQEIKINEDHEIVWVGPTLEERLKGLDEKKKAKKLDENKKFLGATVVRKDGAKGVATKATLEGITVEFDDGTTRSWQKDVVENHIEK